MIAIDTNLLVYAHRRDTELHSVAVERLRGLAESGQPWALPWPCVHEFLAAVTNRRIWRRPSTLRAALDQVDAWLQSPGLNLLGEGPTHWDELRRLVEGGRASGARIHDARIAALCLEHGIAVLWSLDRDFGRFPSLSTVNPLVST